MSEIGQECFLIPENSRSGMRHVTIDAVLYVDRRIVDEEPQIEYRCSGTPVDCVRIAINELLPKKSDLCVSGIDHGQNASTSVIYSGTMSVVVEAGVQGVPPARFSLYEF